MIKQLHDILKRAETWPQELQDEALATLLSIEQARIGDYQLTAEDRAALARSEQDMRAGRFAPDADVAKFFGRSR